MYSARGYFDTVIGEQEGVPKKPDPSGALKAAKDLWRGSVRVPVFWRYEYGHEDWKEREDDDGGSSLGIQGP